MTTLPKRIGVIANKKRADAGIVLEKLQRKADELGFSLITCEQTHQFLPKATHVGPSDFVHSIDLLMALGGDGTLLFCARLLNGAKVPIFGINLGNLGFLTSLREEELETAMDAIASGKVRVSPRTMMHCKVIGEGETIREYRALNDLVLSWGSSVRIANIEVTVDDRPVTIYACDGLIVSTPTGSTGHSLSAGGPIVHPETTAFIMTVICPHSLSARPVVIPEQSKIRILLKGSKELILAVDGQSGLPLTPGHELEIVRADHGVELLTLPSYSYFSVLREKLGWRGSST